MQREHLDLKPGDDLEEFIFELGSGNNRVFGIVLVRREDVPQMMKNIHLQFAGGKRTYRPVKREETDAINYKDVVNEIKQVFKKKGMRIE